MPQFSKTLRPNEVFTSIANMIIAQNVDAKNIGHVNSKLVDAARVDAGLYGDQILFYSTDCVHSKAWDGTDTDVLEQHRPADPQCQAIVIDKFRQIPLTVDNYLTKRAWGTEGAFNSFNSVMKGWMADSKKIHNSTTYNTFIGTAEATAGKQELTVELPASATPEMEAKLIAQKIADLMVEMGDPSRDFNNYGFMRSYDEDDVKIVWNSAYVNKIRKVDLPTIFHNEGLMGDKFAQYVLPSKYFGKKYTPATTSIVMSDIKSRKIRTKEELPGDNSYLIGDGGGGLATTTPLFAGERITDKDIRSDGAGSTIATKLSTTLYEEDDTIICKIYTKLPPFATSFSVGTSFYNSKSLSENFYSTWGYNTLELLDGYPCITIRAHKA